MKRRQFVKETAILSAAAAVAPRGVLAAEEEISSRRIPRWRGFNIQKYDDYKGHKLDRKMLELLKSS